MNNYVIPIFCAAISVGISNPSSAESLRCKTKLAQVGNTKAEVLDKCGDPIMTDSFCQPIAAATQPQGVQVGDNNVQNNIAITTCEHIDVWTYNPGKGKFMAHLYFSRGQLQNIRYGERAK